MFAHQRMAQTAADAAVQAAIMSIYRGTNASSTHPFSTAASFTCTVPPAALDLRTPCVYAQDNGFGTSVDTVTVSFPSTITGVALSSVTTPAVSVNVQRVVSTTFMRFLGISTVTMIANASAGTIGATGTNCVIALAGTGSNNSFQLSGSASNVTMNCGIAVDSAGAQAANIPGGAALTASKISIVGGYNGGTYSPTPTTGAAVVADPFASVTGPTVGACTYTNYQTNSNAALSPGTYCGGINIGGSANVTFASGVYILNASGLLQLGGNSVSTGTGVTFYLTGSPYKGPVIANSASVTFSAPTSGAYEGLLFFQDRTEATATRDKQAVLDIGANEHLTGTLYFPTTMVDFCNGKPSSDVTAIVAYYINIDCNAQLNKDTTGTQTGIGSQTVGLMQ